MTMGNFAHVGHIICLVVFQPTIIIFVGGVESSTAADMGAGVT